MDERVSQFRVGVLVLSTVLIIGILVLLFGDLLALNRGTYTVHMKFAQAQGISRDTPVRKSGLLVGRVTNVGFGDDGEVWVTAELNSEAPVNSDEVPFVHGSLLGDAEVHFRRVQNVELERIPLEDNAVIEGRVEGDPLRMLERLNLEGAITSLTGAGDEVNKLARNLNHLLVTNNEQISRIVVKTERALDSVQIAMTNIDGLVGDEQMKIDLKRSVAELPLLLQEANRAVTDIQSVATSANRNLENLENFTRPLGERGDELVGRVDSSVTRLDELLEQLVLFSTALNNREGSLGQLINDPVLYQNLSEATKNINQLTRDLQPVVRDARVFADKIARHPEVLGARGAIRPSSGIK